MKDQAYRRGLRKALSAIVKVLSIKPVNGHLFIEIELPNGQVKQLTAGGSPSDQTHSINHTVRAAKRLLKAMK